MLAGLLSHCVDDLNALSTWFLVMPDDCGTDSVRLPGQIAVSEALSWACECGERWQFADDFYCCKYMPDVPVDEECLDRLQPGTLNCHIRAKDQEWLQVPKWSDAEFFAVGNGLVKLAARYVTQNVLAGS